MLKYHVGHNISQSLLTCLSRLLYLPLIYIQDLQLCDSAYSWLFVIRHCILSRRCGIIAMHLPLFLENPPRYLRLHSHADDRLGQYTSKNIMSLITRN
jgi:hypothetical protein